MLLAAVPEDVVGGLPRGWDWLPPPPPPPRFLRLADDLLSVMATCAGCMAHGPRTLRDVEAGSRPILARSPQKPGDDEPMFGPLGICGRGFRSKIEETPAPHPQRLCSSSVIHAAETT